MSAATAWGARQDWWLLNQKVDFDGVAKTITVNAGITTIDIKVDIYSDWKEWVRVEDNLKYEPAIRTIGGDPAPVGSGQFAGDIYFLINGWQIVVNENVDATGIIFHDDGIPVFVVNPGGGVTNRVSNLAISVAPDAATIANANQPILDGQTTITNSIDSNTTRLTDVEADLELIRAVVAGRAIISPDDLTITVYDTDDVTILAQYSVSADGRTRTRIA